MATYMVRLGRDTICTYNEFSRAGHHGVRGIDSHGNYQEYSGRSALSLARQTAEELASKSAGPVSVAREDGTIAIVIR
jgi:hypothetical protein